MKLTMLGTGNALVSECYNIFWWTAAVETAFCIS